MRSSRIGSTYVGRSDLYFCCQRISYVKASVSHTFGGTREETMIATVVEYTGDVPSLCMLKLERKFQCRIPPSKKARASCGSNLKALPIQHLYTGTHSPLQTRRQWHPSSASQPRRCAPPPAPPSPSAPQRSSATKPPLTTRAKKWEDRQAVLRARRPMRLRFRMDRVI